ncbi:MAG: hypothetical protein JW839_14720, partial [Candidatus Lokiarchaeota archaeon]|nr:hypothetical protein [Candidatus Lokiarchaeota archaeon]
MDKRSIAIIFAAGCVAALCGAAWAAGPGGPAPRPAAVGTGPAPSAPGEPDWQVDLPGFGRPFHSCRDGSFIYFCGDGSADLNVSEGYLVKWDVVTRAVA